MLFLLMVCLHLLRKHVCFLNYSSVFEDWQVLFTMTNDIKLTQLV